MTSFRERLIEEGIRSGEFAAVDATRASTVLKDATSLFLHPFLIPTTLNEPTESRARNVVRFVLAGFSRANDKRTAAVAAPRRSTRRRSARPA